MQEIRSRYYTQNESAWKRFLDEERKQLQMREEGQLARALGSPLPEESAEELEWLSLEDQRLAEEGLVELRKGAEAFFKHVDELTPEDAPARIEATRIRLDWLGYRITRRLELEQESKHQRGDTKTKDSSGTAE